MISIGDYASRQPTIFRSISFCSLFLILVGCASIALAGLSGILGLGVAENFLFFEIFGFSRRDMAFVGLTIVLTGIFTMAGNLALFGSDENPVRKNLFSALHLVFWHRDYFVVILLLPLAIWIVFFHVFVIGDFVFVAPDSNTYFTFHPSRTLGYSVFVRAQALFFDDPKAIATVQIVIGCAAVVFFSEALQRLVRNYLLSVGVGVALLFNWPIFEHGTFLLSDQPFIALLLVHVGFVFLALHEPKKLFLFGAALFLVLSIWMRPVGLIFLASPVFLILVQREYWKRIALWLGGPLIGLLIVQAALNHAVFGYFGLSRFSGWPMLVNTLYLTKKEMPTEHPELIAELSVLAEERRSRLAALPDIFDKKTALVNDTNQFMGEGSTLIAGYIERRGVTGQAIDVGSLSEFAKFWNESSQLNKSLGTLGVSSTGYHLVHDAFLKELWREALLHSPVDFLKLTWLKFIPSWTEPFHMFYAPSDTKTYFSQNMWLDLSGPRATFRTPPNPSETTEVINLLPSELFFLVNGSVRAFMEAVHAKVLSAITALIALSGVLIFTLWRQSVPPTLAVAAYSGAMSIAYLLAVSYAHVPIGRYTMVTLPFMLLLSTIPFHILLTTIHFFEKRNVSSEKPQQDR